MNRSVRMSLQSTPTLLQLAMQNLLRDEALAISALQHLPVELFPPLFKDAFTHKRFNILRKMVQVWPFPCLPLGGLMKMKAPYLDILQIVLDGIDALLDQNSHPRSYKLRVLDLRALHKDFWTVWAGDTTASCTPGAKYKRKIQRRGPKIVAQPNSLKVFVDLCLKPRALDTCLSFVFQWVRERKALLQLGCKKLKINTVAIQNVVKVLDMLDLDCMEEVEVCCTWKLSTLATFAPYLGRMTNLLSFILSHIHVPASITPEEKKQLVSQFTSQFPNLRCLQDLSLDSVGFLKDQMDQVFRCLEAPLEILSITDCQLSESDLKSLSQCPGIRQLKHLNLSGVILTNISPEPLRVLLERVAATLKTLDLENCMIMDSQLNVFLPALSQCVQLIMFNYLRNPISVAVLERLLYHTSKLSYLSLEMYSTPWEIYGAQSASHHKRLDQLREELSKTMMHLEHNRTVWFSVAPCLP
ncbi:PRAME family member 12-like isoform X2 [Mastomys coucha]|uniref:PRAME family member 12-like isoform X2 n=2 Tax=Mastomys coucha TaxID=35658 RepID=UPI001262875B|nr:PRAME family member 12-like isoform X2 [Mastomys coucha]